MKIVKKDQKRRCAYCGSNKWKYMKRDAKITLKRKDSFDKAELFFSQSYKCEKCRQEFIAEGISETKYTNNVERCCFCKSKNIRKISCKDADVELYWCKQCNSYMGIENKKEGYEHNISCKI